MRLSALCLFRVSESTGQIWGQKVEVTPSTPHHCRGCCCQVLSHAHLLDDFLARVDLPVLHNGVGVPAGSRVG